MEENWNYSSLRMDTKKYKLKKIIKICSICPLWVSVLIGTQSPELNIPKVVIYGERKIEIEVLKRELTSDTIPTNELPKLNPPKLKFDKSSHLYSYKPRNSLFNLKGCAGGSGTIKGFYGREHFFTSLSYSNDVKGIKNGFGTNVGGNFKNISLEMGYGIKDYHNRKEYKVFETTAGYIFKSFSLNANGIFSDLEEKRETGLSVYSNYFTQLKQFNTEIDLCIAHNNLLDSLVLSIEGKIAGNFEDWFVEPGIKFFSQSPWILPVLRIEKHKVMWLEYSPYFSLTTRDKALNYNRFTGDKAYINKSKRARIGGKFKNIKLNFDWIQNYSYFVKSDELYHQSDTTLFAINGIIGQKFGAIRLKYNVSGSPEYIPPFLLGLDFNWMDYNLKLDYGGHSDYTCLDCEISWMFHKNLTLFVDIRNLFDEDDQMFDIYYESRRKILLGLDLKL